MSILSKMRADFEALDIPDIQPLLIWKGTRSLSDMIWVHPYIDTWFTPAEFDLDQDMHIVTFNCGPESLSVAFKSNWINLKYDKYFSNEDWETNNKHDVYGKEYVDTSKIFDTMLALLEDDMFVALPRTSENLNTIKKICAFREKYSKGQFCFSPEGVEVDRILRSCVSANFTSDCGFHYDKTRNVWGYDT